MSPTTTFASGSFDDSTSARSSATAPGPAARRFVRPRLGSLGRRGVVSLLVGCSLAAGGIAVVSVGPWQASRPGPDAKSAAAYFLGHYERRSGEVVRFQGGDTVSEGEGYAMLLAAALGERGRFAAAWNWSVKNLEQPSGLFAWHFAGGHVLDPSPASDADLDIAWSLLVAAQRFHQPAYRADARRIGAAILANETVVAKGRPILVAGPWARNPAPIVNPSYFAPLAMRTLATVGGEPAWNQVAASSRIGLSELLSNGVDLPPDWAIIDSNGVAHPTPPPSGGPVLYGFNAVRVPLWLATSCVASDRSLAARMWPTLHRALRAGPDLVNLDLGGGTSAPGASSSPVGLVGAAAAALAAGSRSEARALLSRADALNRSAPTYYGSALVALGEVLLSSSRLGGCADRPSDEASLTVASSAAAPWRAGVSFAVKAGTTR